MTTLLNIGRDTGGPPLEVEPPSSVLELYRLATEMADRISSRRASANTFFLTLNTAVAGVLSAGDLNWYLAAAGTALCIVWLLLLRSYRDLNRAKFAVILSLEEQLPVRIYTDEWAVLKPAGYPTGAKAAGARLARYRELGTLERVVPAVFIAIYVFDVVRQWLI